MIKNFLTFAFAVFATTSAFAFGHKRVLPTGEQFKATSTVADKKTSASQTRASQTLDYTLADEVYTAVALNNVTVGTEIWEAFELAGDVATQFAGDKITSINVTTGTVPNGNSAGPNTVIDVTVFLSYDLAGTPFYTQAATLVSNPYTEVKVALDTPYEIEAGKSVFVGYYFNLPDSKVYYIPVDGYATDDMEGCYVGLKQAGKLSWMNFANQIGNICMGCTIEGETMPENGLMLYQGDGDLYVAPGGTFDYKLVVKGDGLSTESMTVSCTVGEETPIENTFTFNQSLGYNQYGLIELTGLVCNTIGTNVPVKFEITKVNGVANTSTKKSKTFEIACFPESDGFPRLNLLEEGTGSTCQFCPRGIVLLDYIRETYPDKFACAALHSSLFGKDPMEVASTAEWFSSMGVNSLPCGFVNRNYEVLQGATVEDMYEEIDDFVSKYGKIPALMGFPAMDCVVDGTTVKVDTKVKTSMETINNNRYRLAFYITEDNVGPYSQKNAYASGMYGEMAGWERKSASAKTYYNEVVRLMVGGFAGISNSLPAKFEAGTEYSYSNTMSIANVKGDTFFVTAFIVDTQTYEIANAFQKEVSKTEDSGVEGIEADAANVVSRKFYDLSGVEVSEPTNGLYLVRTIFNDGTVKTAKQIVK